LRKRFGRFLSNGRLLFAWQAVTNGRALSSATKNLAENAFDKALGK